MFLLDLFYVLLLINSLIKDQLFKCLSIIELTLCTIIVTYMVAKAVHQWKITLIASFEVQIKSNASIFPLSIII